MSLGHLALDSQQEKDFLFFLQDFALSHKDPTIICKIEVNNSINPVGLPEDKIIYIDKVFGKKNYSVCAN